MTIEDLMELPETHKAIVGEYQGPYSLGVETEPEFGFVLKVEPECSGDFPTRVTVAETEFPVRVVYGFVAPTPLKE